MKKAGVVLIIILSFLFNDLKANHITDSLEVLLTKAKDTTKVKILCDLCWEYRQISADKALEYGLQALELAKEIGFKKGVAQSYNDVGIIYIDRSDYSKAINCFDKALDIRKELEDKSGIASLYNKMGIVYQKQGKLKAALESQIQALSIYEELGQEQWVSYSLNNIAIIQQNLGNLEQSLNYHKKALEQRLINEDIYGEGMSHGNIGNVYVKMKDTASAISNYNRALHIFRSLNNDEAISVQLSNLGNIYLAKNQNQEALRLLEESLIIREKIGDQKAISSSLIKLGEVYTNLGAYESASVSLYNGLLIARTIMVVEEEMAAYLVLAKMYSLENSMDSAYGYTRKYIALKDSVYNQNLKQQIVDVQIKYETEKVEQDNALLKSENQLNEARLQQRRMEVWLLILVIVSISGVSVFLLYRRRLKQKAAMDAALIRHNEIAIKAVLEGQEVERRRIARELHDGVGQKLAGIKLNWENLSTKIEDRKQYFQFHDMSVMLDNAASEVRSISHQMMPKELEQYGLVPGIKNMLNNNMKHSGIEFRFDHLGFEKRLPELLELNLFRILQELTTNVLKHAEATKLNIQLLRRNGSIVLISEDNGKGFKIQPEKYSGIGMMNIESRVKAIDGIFDIESEVGKGTTVRVRAPINE